MKPYPSIADSVQELSNGEIIKYKRKYILPIICMICGLFIIIWGIYNWNLIGYELTSYILVFTGAFLMGWGVVMLTAKSEYFIIRETGERIMPEKVFLDPEKKDLVLQLLNDGKLEDVLKHSIKDKSPLMLELWKTKGHKLLYSQLIYAHDSKSVPISKVIKHNKEELATT